MKRILAFLIFLALGACASPPKLADDAVEALMRREQVQGLAVALIDDARVVKLASYGWRNAGFSAADPPYSCSISANRPPFGRLSSNTFS